MSVFYDADDQTADFGSPQASVDLRIYQLNAVRGRGYPGSATVMTTTPNLGLTHLQPNSSQPEVPVNALADGLDKAGNTKLPWTITGNTTVTQAQLASAALHVLGGTPGAGFNFDLPAGVARLFAIKNDSGQTATVQVIGGAGANVAVSTGTTRILHTDGTDVIVLA